MEQDNKTGAALVLGGGGVGGIAWMTGLLRGLEEQGLALPPFDRVVGTSAGATVAAQVCSGLGLEALYQRQVDPDLQVAELQPAFGRLGLALRLLPALLAIRKPAEFRRRVCAIALKAKTVEPARRLAVIAARLHSHDWPEVPLTVMAFDARTVEPRPLDRDSGVSLVDAVAASCAVPGVWPPVAINGSPCIDGAVRSGTNADLAAGAVTVLVIAPMGYRGLTNAGGGLAAEVAGLEADGTRVLVITPDTPSQQAFGTNPLDPATRAPSARAGRAQAAALVAPLQQLFSGDLTP